MRHKARRRTRASRLLLVSAVLFSALVLLAVPFNRSKTSAQAGAQRDSESHPGAKLDAQRRLALKQLDSRLRAGDPFSREEIEILTRFAAGYSITELEADTLISRALYNRYVVSNPLSREQESLLDLYSGSVARREHDIADFKFSSLEMRSAAAAAPVAVKVGASPNVVLVAPPNDLCAGAEVISGSGPFPVSTAVTADITDATTTGDPPLPSCQASVSRSIWYTFTPTTTATYVISSCADAPTGSTVDDTVLAIYMSTGGCGGTITEIATSGNSDGCDDDSCVVESLQSVITTQLNSGTQYFFVVWEFGTTVPTAGNTAVQLQVSQFLPPANDTCGSAPALTLNTPVAGSTVAATDDYQLTGTTCFSGVGQTSSLAPGRDVAYSFTAPSAGTYSFKVTNYPTASNLVLYVATSCPSSGAVACDSALGPVKAAANRNTTSSSEEIICMSLTSSQQVFIFVDENAVTGGGSFTIEANRCTAETEPNGTPATGAPIPFGVEGSITPAADVDFFNLGTPQSGSRVFALADGVAGNSNGDFVMRVTTSTDTLEFDDDNCDVPFGSLAPNVAGTPLTGVASFIRMNHFLVGTAAEPYRLYAAVQPPGGGLGGSSATAESEPNDTTGQANSATNNFFSGSLGPTDIDHFSFNLNAGELVFLSLDCDPLRDNTPINGALELDDFSGTLLISVNDGGSTSSTASGAGSLTATTPNSPAEGLVWRARYTGVYFARVSTTGTGDYLLSISRNGQIGPTAANGVVSGRIVDNNGNPVEGAVVNLSGTQTRKTITDANGNYRFNEVETNGFYTVTPSRVNYNFNPFNRSFSQLGNSTEATFTATSTGDNANPLDTPEYFVRQHYLDFLGREPDESGFNFWSDQILECGNDAACLEQRTINVSAAYFLSIEFLETGGLVDGLYRASYDRRPLYSEFMPDTRTVAHNVVVGDGDWAQQLAANKQAFLDAWVQRPAFRAAYDGLANESYVDTLISHTGVSFTNSERDALVSSLNNQTSTRADVLREVVENDRFVSAKRNATFVMMEYFGYLRRDPDESGYQFWLNKLNQFGGNFEQAEMVKAFLVSGEYRQRFRL